MFRQTVRATSALLLAILLAACGSASVTTPAGSGSDVPAASLTPGVTPAAGTTDRPAATDEPAASAAPEESAAPERSAEPGATEAPAGSGAPTSPDPGTSGSPAPVPAECSGTAENRDFFAAAAETVSWDVYCAVLPDGWFVDAGSYRLADGGRLDVTYRGPGGESIELQEGAFCTTGASACSPRDHELGPIAFGDRTGMLVTLGPDPSDGYAVYVDPGAAPSWAATGKGMDQATFTGIAAALTRVSP